MQPIRVKTVQESDLRMLGSLARNIQRVLPVTQADIDAAAALGEGWVVWKVFEVSEPLDNMRGGTQLIIRQNSILPGQNVRRVMFVSGPGGQTVVIRGSDYIVLPDAIADSLTYVKAFGGTEQRNLPDNYIERQFIYMMYGSYLLTDIVPTYDCKIEMDFATTSVSSSKTILGGRTATYGGMELIIASSKNFVVDAFGTDSADRYSSSVTAQNNKRYKFTYANQVATLESGGSTLFTNTMTGTAANGAALCINGNNDSGSVAGVGEIYLYSFKVWNGQGELVADYVPAVQKGTVPVVGFYDMVSKTFITATAGTFAAGGEAVPTPDAPMDIVSNNGVLKARHQSGLPLGYTLLDYATFDGTQEVDTGLYIHLNDEIRSKFNGTTTSFVYGASTSNPRITCYLAAGGNQRWGNAAVDNTGMVVNTLYTVVQNKTSFTLNGVSKNYPEGTEFTTNDTLTIGNCNGNTSTPKFSGNFYYIEIDQSGVLVAKMLPCTSPDNVVGFYDVVRDIFLAPTSGTLVAGTTATDATEIYTDGTVETINVHTRNLFSGIVEQGGLSDGTGGETTSSARIRTTAVPVKPNTTYNVSWTTNSEMAVVIRNAHFYNASNTWISRLNASTFTTPPDTAFVRFVWQHSDSTSDVTPSDISNVQLELGLTPTAYVPYFDGGTATAEMLLKVGDYQDVQSIIDGVVTRKVGVMVLDGVTAGRKIGTAWNTTYKRGSFAVPDMKSTASGVSDALSSHFVYNQSVFGAPTVAGFCTNNGSVFFCFLGLDNVTSADTANAWLADQYAAGTPVIVVYPLATATTESVTGQTLQVTGGDNIVEITQASLTGLELEVEYQAAVSLTIQEVQDANLDPNVEVTIN